MPPQLNELIGIINADRVVRAFGGLITNTPIWFDQSAGIVSVNTQARRLGNLNFLAGKVANGTKIESLLLTIPTSDLALLNSNLLANGCLSGQLSNKASSVEHYLDAAMQLRLLTRQGAMFALTNRGRFLTNVIRPNFGEPYPLPCAAKIFLFDTLLRSAFLGLVAILRLMLREKSGLSELQGKYRDELLTALENVLRNASDSRLRRIAQDRIISIRGWRKPESYAEHLVPAQLNWLLDLGIVRQRPSQEYDINPDHRVWIENLVQCIVPREADIFSWVLDYGCADTLISKPQVLTACGLLGDAFARIAQPGVLMKLRSVDLILYLVCYHSHALLHSLLEGESLFSASTMDCGERSYKFTFASRMTQSFVVCAKKGNV